MNNSPLKVVLLSGGALDGAKMTLDHRKDGLGVLA